MSFIQRFVEIWLWWEWSGNPDSNSTTHYALAGKQILKLRMEKSHYSDKVRIDLLVFLYEIGVNGKQYIYTEWKLIDMFQNWGVLVEAVSSLHILWWDLNLKYFYLIEIMNNTILPISYSTYVQCNSLYLWVENDDSLFHYKDLRPLRRNESGKKSLHSTNKIMV